MSTEHRAGRFVDAANWNYFHRRWREIVRDWPITVDEHAGAIRDLRENAREHLRAELREAVSTGPAVYLIPV
jgi:hypothetical protein